MCSPVCLTKKGTAGRRQCSKRYTMFGFVKWHNPFEHMIREKVLVMLVSHKAVGKTWKDMGITDGTSMLHKNPGNTPKPFLATGLMKDSSRHTPQIGFRGEKDTDGKKKLGILQET